MTPDSGRLSAALVGRYAIARELGAGGMATVYLAHDIRHDRDVALKVLRPELAAVLGADRFLQEIRISARLDHPHILTLIDSGEHDGFVWYVLPYVRGESLRARLTREKQLPIEDTVRLAAQVASALDYSHRQGVIHRDIKPENILLHEGEAVVADFGIALAVRNAGGARLTESGLSLGTPQYMSPEQATGDRELDARSDEYSLTAVVYEMLAGEPPHTGPTVQAVIAKLLTERPTRIRTVRAAVPEHIDAAIARGLAKVPADRFGSVAQFAAALEAAGTAQTGRSRRRAALIGGIIGIAAIAALLVKGQPWRRSPSTAALRGDAASVAVLPFENLTGNPSDGYLSDGMTEEVIGQLAHVSGLKVISHTSTEALKGGHLTLRQIADTLGVRHILEGSVRHAGTRIRVTVNLIDATTDTHVWESDYDRDLTDMFAVQEEIARHVADSLGSVIGLHPSLGRVAHTDQPAAYAAYQTGRFLLYRRTREGLRGALQQFQLAIAADSGYAPAYAGLATVYVLWGAFNYPGIDPYDALGRALQTADHAVRLDSTLAEAYAVRAYALTLAWAPTKDAMADFQRALALQPNVAEVHQWYAQLLSREGRFEDGLTESERAVALDPLAPGTRDVAALEALGARHYEMAIEAAERALVLEPGLMDARQLDALGNLLLGHAERCVAMQLGIFAGEQAICLQAMGNHAAATRIVDSLRAVVSGKTVPDSSVRLVFAARELARYAAWVGNPEESVMSLERAFALSPLAEDPPCIASGLYDKVRNDARFEAGVARIGAQINARVQLARRGT